MEDVVGAIKLVAPNAEGRITWASEPLPFPDSYEAEVLERVLGPVVQTTLTDGVRETVEHFRHEVLTGSSMLGGCGTTAAARG